MFLGGGQVVQIRFINSLPAGRYRKKCRVNVVPQSADPQLLPWAPPPQHIA